ncbi:alkyl hydroperoxide reductase [Gloeobacter kilaueensis]|uniref:Alkyl hydroperoxide reductase/ Thiol specific antioxidant/ Mal allergen n=1 Tax=Gloeobacter kilaueensis (strain ATCC BAA-2537 / CCAP 1431/1 / ULC 316 / JS1) TaxID=1183438 RepID=U5QKB4_GLOK1|nr:alkyl hydroperoxide reductase [Gloeobacter kilaueensis]AGY59308.1 alkyl hydroperoxide reductase/ Thiol specific antioxidant/ Mal allergen [Gloeobacter kilaueensis JS1]
MFIQPGSRLPLFKIAGTDGQVISSADFRQRYNLLLIFLDQPRQLDYLDGFVAAAEQLRLANTRAIAFLSQSGFEKPLPFATVLDPERRIYEQLGIPEKALVLSDRFATVRKIFWAPEPIALPEVPEVLSWVEFIDLECHECNTPLF